MVVLGLILLLVAVAAGVVLVVENSGSDHTVSISAFGGTWQADAYWLAAVGAAILLVGVLGIALMRAGGKRGLRRRQERKQLERENAALAERVRREKEAAARTEAAPAAPPLAGGPDAPVHPGTPATHGAHGTPAAHGAAAARDPFVKRDEPTYDAPPAR